MTTKRPNGNNYQLTTSAHKADAPSRTQTRSFHHHSFTGKEWCKSQWLAQRGLVRGFSETGYSYFGARYYDSDLSGLFLSVDPMAYKYPSISSYAYCAWNPVKLVDPDGRIIKPTPGSSASFIKQLNKAMSYLRNNGANTIMNQLDNLPLVIYVSEISFNDAQKGLTRTNSSKSTIYWCPNAAVYTTNDIIISPATVLNHEFDHALQGAIYQETKSQDKQTYDYQYGNVEERRVITGSEQETAALLGEIMPWQMTREDHYGGTCWVDSPELSEIKIPYRLTEPQTFTLKKVKKIETKIETE